MQCTLRVPGASHGGRDCDSAVCLGMPSLDAFMIRTRLLTVMLSVMLAVLSTVMLSAAMVPASGQSVPCTNCLVTTHVVRLELDVDGSQVVTTAIPEVVRTARGEYLVGPVNRDQQLALYSPSGQFVRTIGRAGRGPGEFHSIARVARGAGDSVLVYDAATRRLSILSPSLQFVRSVSLADHRQLKQGSGFFVGVDPVGTSGSIAGLHLYESSRGLLRRHIPLASPTLRGDSAPRVAAVAVAARDEIWAYRLRDSLLVLSDTMGTRRRQIRVAPSWHRFPVERVRRSPGTPQRGELPAVSGTPTRPWSGVGAMDVDSAGLVWLLGAVPRAGWERRPSPFLMQQPETRRSRPPEPVHAELIERLNGWFEARVEVFDVSGPTARSLGVAVLPTGREQLLGNGYVAGVGVHDDGSVYVDVWRVAPAAQRRSPRASKPAPRR